METNLTKYKKDVEDLIEKGFSLYKGLYYELRNELNKIKICY